MYKTGLAQIVEDFDNYGHVWESVQNIPGYVTKNEGFLLYLSGKHFCQLGDVVELGSFYGKSSVILGLGLLGSEKRKGKLICVENFVKQTSSSFPDAKNPKKGLLDNIKRFDLDNVFELYEENSIIALQSIKPETCGMVFIDSEHSGNQISQEFPLSLNAVHRQGIILIHDYMNPAVDASYTEWIMKNIQSKYNTIYFQDSTPEYRGNGLLIVQTNQK